jgi:hypothetical protein
MTPLTHATGALALLVLAACAPTTVVDDGGNALVNGDFVAGTENACGANTRQDLVGQNASVLNTAILPDNNRTIYPDVVENSRYDVGRLTIRVDATGTITSVACG